MDFSLTPDSWGYLRAAAALVEGHYSPGGIPELGRLPGYPALLALVGVEWVVPVQAMMVIGIGWLVRMVSGSWRAGLIAVVMPLSVVYALFVLTETMYALSVMACVTGAVMYRRRGGYWLAVAIVGGVVGAYVKPIGIIVPVIVGVVLWRRCWMVPVVAVVLFSPWLVRNVSHGYYGVSTIGASTLKSRAVAFVVADVRGVSLEEAREMGAGVEVLYEHPGSYAFVCCRGLARMCINSPTEMFEWGHEGWPWAVGVAMQVMLWVAVVYGSVRAFFIDRRLALLLWLVAVAHLVVATVVLGDAGASRFAHAAMITLVPLVDLRRKLHD